MKHFLALAALLVPALVAAEPLILAPGKSVAVVDAEDPSIRVVLTAPADRPLDVDALLAANGSVYALATRMQVRAADTIVRNADGSLSLGAAPVAARAPTVENGVIVVDRGRYAHYKVAPAVQAREASGINELLRRQDEVPFKGPLDIVGSGGALVLPTGLRIR